MCMYIHEVCRHISTRISGWAGYPTALGLTYLQAET